MSDAAAASVCACLPDFFRTSEEGPEKECTGTYFTYPHTVFVPARTMANRRLLKLLFN